MKVRFAAELAERLAEPASGRRSVTQVCNHLGISRQTYYRWLREHTECGLAEFLAPTSRRPRSSPRHVPAEIEDEIVRVRKRLQEQGWDCGAVSIHTRLLRAGQDPIATMALPWVPSRTTIHRILRRRGQVVDQPAKRPRSANGTFEYSDPNGCWQIDGTGYQLATSQTVCILKIIDDHSRRIMRLLAATSENLHDTTRCVTDAIAIHGRPARMLSDRGSALNGHPDRQSQFRNLLTGLGIEPISSRGYHPQTCGKAERSHQTLGQWLAARPPATDLPALQALLDTFTAAFNDDRPHQALGGDTPTGRYQAGTKASPGAPRPPRQISVTTVKVSNRGEIVTGTYSIQIGRTWAGATVTVLRDDLHVTITCGPEHIRTLDINPAVRYQGNGRPQPQSPKPHPRRVSRMS